MSPIVCVACGGVVDRLRDPARVASGRIVHTCRGCAGLSTDAAHDGSRRARAASQSACARCGSQVALYEARPVAGADGRIALACVECADGQGDRQGEIAASPDALASARVVPAWRRQPAALGALALAMLLAGLYLRNQVPPRSAAADSLRTASAPVIGHMAGAGSVPAGAAAQPGVAEDDGELDDHDHAWLEDIERGTFDQDGEQRPTIEDMRERSEPLEERLPTLADWVFPVLGSDEPFPLKPTRRFGAGRDGRLLPECGRGHCGVDLDGPRGTPVVAVAWGVVTRVERRSDQSSGKYVRIEHPDSVYTAYMHLDDIADELRVGDEIDAGDVVGTLGRTGIKQSAPHLHFSLAVPSGNQLVHIDPASYLERAERLSAK